MMFERTIDIRWLDLVTTSETVMKRSGELAARAEAVMVARDLETAPSRPRQRDERRAIAAQIPASSEIAAGERSAAAGAT